MATLRLTKFTPDPAFEAGLLRSTAVRRLLADLIDQALVNAERRAPFRLGLLEVSIRTVVAVDVVRQSLIGRMFATDFKAPWWEFGTARNTPVPFLRPGLEEAVPGASWEDKTR